MNRVLTHLVIALVFLALSIAAYVFAFLAIEKTRDQIAEVSGKTVALVEDQERIKEAQGALAALSQNESRITGYFLNEKEIVSFLEEVESAGEALGADVTVVAVNNERNATPPRVSVALRITGSFDAVMRTIGVIEYQSYDGIITTITMDDQGSGVWGASITYSVGTTKP